jgi:hypothetical protein
MIRFEMMLLILAGLLLNRIMLSEKAVDMTNQENLLPVRLGVAAVSVANSYIDRVTGSALSFDEFTTANAVEPLSSDSVAKLPSLSASLGRDAGEVNQSQFDDIDDYNGLDTMITVQDVGNFRVRCTLRYFDPTADSTTTSKTWCKQFSVSVTDTIPGSNKSYFVFNGTKAEVKKVVVLSYQRFLN